MSSLAIEQQQGYVRHIVFALEGSTIGRLYIGHAVQHVVFAIQGLPGVGHESAAQGTAWVMNLYHHGLTLTDNAKVFEVSVLHIVAVNGGTCDANHRYGEHPF